MKIVKASEVGEYAIEKMLTKASFDEVELSPKIREANKKTFGRDMTAAELVRQIVGDVRREGDAAVIRYTHLIDRVDYKPEDFLVTEAEYEAAEKAADPSLANTGLFRFAAEGVGGASAPFAVVSAGGGFAYVAAMHDSFPHCLHLARAGINGFAVIYRPDAQLACEDLARAVSFIFELADELGVDTAGYSLCGGSAGARMAAWVGGYGPAAFGAPAGTPPPAPVIMQYTGMSELTGADPATYACVGDRDGIASWHTMQGRIDALAKTGVPTEFHVYEGLSHGFGLGVDTVAEGWIDDALAFWKAQR